MTRFLTMLAATSALLLPATAAQAAGVITAAKNVIIMIADGSGYNTLQATRLYQNSPLYTDGNGFLSTSMSTYALSTRTTPVAGAAGLAQDPNTVYNSARNWDTTPVAGTRSGYPRGFGGYEWNRDTAPDSANTMAAMMTGVKTYNNAVNVNGNGTALLTVAESAVQNGRKAGVISTVEFNDATPTVTGGAHNVARANHDALAYEMFNAGTLSVIGGTGNPDYNDNGTVRATPNYGWMPKPLWDDLKAGTNNSGYNSQNWSLAQNRDQIQAIANSTAAAPDKLAMIIKGYTGSQAYRGAGIGSALDSDPYSTPLRTDVPTYAELLLAGLTVLDTSNNGLYFMGEQGEPDRAMHSNNLGRMIESYQDFQAGVKAVVDWVSGDSSKATWDDTLLIVTADHDHLLFGPDAAANPFQPVQPDGTDANGEPDYSWLSGSHSNQLVPLFVKGVGADNVIGLADQVDSYTDAQGRTFGRGNYTDQAEVGQYLLGAVTAVPEPSTWATMMSGLAIIGAALRRRKRLVPATA